MARLPRQRDEPRRTRVRADPKASGPSPNRPARGLSRGMIVVLALTAVVGVLSVTLLECGNRGEATRARVHWNAASPSTRKASLDDLRGQAEARAGFVIDGALLARITASRIDGKGMVDLDYGSASFDFVAPPGARKNGTPCGVELALAWQGWQTRVRSACADPPLVPRCKVTDAFARAFPGADGDLLAQVVLEVEAKDGDDGTGGPTWTFWGVEPAGKPIEIADDCSAR